MLDAYPDHVIPAKVVFVASQAQFTPKAVETKAERDKLMFRIRVRIDPERLKGQRGDGQERAAGRRLCVAPISPWPWPANLHAERAAKYPELRPPDDRRRWHLRIAVDGQR